MTFRRRRGGLKKRYGRPDSGSSRSFRRCLRCSWLGLSSKTHVREGKVTCPKCGGEDLMVIK